MISINKNYSLNKLRGLIHQQFEKNSTTTQQELNEEQKEILDIFNKRIFLEETIEETISFNRRLNWNKEDGSYQIVTTAEDLIEVFKLRSDVYEMMQYGSEFPDTIEGLNFDKYDHHSAIIFCKKDKEFTGTSRVIFDSKKNKLPTDIKYSLNYLREENMRFGETSRLTVKKETKGLSLDFKNIMKAYHDVVLNNELDMIVSSIAKGHYKLYSRFGGMQIETELDTFGELDGGFYVIKWDLREVSAFYKRSFLR